MPCQPSRLCADVDSDDEGPARDARTLNGSLDSRLEPKTAAVTLPKEDDDQFQLDLWSLMSVPL